MRTSSKLTENDDKVSTTGVLVKAGSSSRVGLFWYGKLLHNVLVLNTTVIMGPTGF